uniref:Reverse transcriptase domain-containing protein n=1 Tax=Tanacetum cinerariifolium TaxID=118510 RepID=A0A699H271_TANCI|nr:hypothetical protein [Tanacetum cinerariifolium]
MAKMFKLLRELTSSRTLEKVLVREETSNPITKNINVISLIKMEKKNGVEGDKVAEGNMMKLNKSGIFFEILEETPRSQHIGFYLKQEINEKLIKGLVDNYKYKDSLLAIRLDFMILDIKEDRIKPFILGTPFLTTAKAVIIFEKGTITLKSGKNKIDFVKVPALPSELWKSVEDDLDPTTLTNTVSRLVLEWEKTRKYHQEKEMEFNQWRSAYAIAVEVFDPLPSLCIWEALGAYKHDLDLFRKETGQDCNFTRSGFKNMCIVPEDDVRNPCDPVRIYKGRRHNLCDGVKTKLPQRNPKKILRSDDVRILATPSSSCPSPEQAPSQPLIRKRKHQELEPEIKIPWLEYNRSLPKKVLFVNNVIIKEPEYGMFFINVYGDEAFHIMNDMYKVDIETLLSYIVIASNITTTENTRFCLKLRKMIAYHPDQHKLESKRVKLESLDTD